MKSHTHKHTLPITWKQTDASHLQLLWSKPHREPTAMELSSYWAHDMTPAGKTHPTSELLLGDSPLHLHCSGTSEKCHSSDSPPFTLLMSCRTCSDLWSCHCFKGPFLNAWVTFTLSLSNRVGTGMERRDQCCSLTYCKTPTHTGTMQPTNVRHHNIIVGWVLIYNKKFLFNLKANSVLPDNDTVTHMQKKQREF